MQGLCEQSNHQCLQMGMSQHHFQLPDTNRWPGNLLLQKGGKTHCCCTPEYNHRYPTNYPHSPHSLLPTAQHALAYQLQLAVHDLAEVGEALLTTTHKGAGLA